MTNRAEPPKAPWAELVRDGRARFTVLISLGVGLHALQILVMAIIMPTVIADIGGVAYFTWGSMVYTIGGIVGTVAVAPVWSGAGARQGYTLSGCLSLIGTLGTAMAPDMGWLIAARSIQGIGGGLVLGGGMALIGAFYDSGLRTRILAVYQGVWMIAQLLGPVHGGAFAEFDWWRGAFWVVVPFIVIFIGLSWLTVPERLDGGTGDGRTGDGGRFPLLRLGLLGSGVLAIASAGLMDAPWQRLALILAAPALIWLTFRLDGRAAERIFPTDSFSPRRPVGLALWILFLIGISQNAILLFLPLLLLVVHGVTPFFISFLSIIISVAWTIGTFAVSGFSGGRERLALRAGPLLALFAIATLAGVAEQPLLWLLALGAFLLGFGIGIHNVHLVSRTMAHAREGEERITSSSVASIRSLGTATGAAMAGMLVNIAGLGDATDPQLVGSAIGFVWMINLVPISIAALFMFALVRFGPGR